MDKSRKSVHVALHSNSKFLWLTKLNINKSTILNEHRKKNTSMKNIFLRRKKIRKKIQQLREIEIFERKKKRAKLRQISIEKNKNCTSKH